MELTETARTRLRRKAERGHFDWETVTAILDEGFVCHFGFAADGHAAVIPMAYGRIDRDLYVHGAAANHALRSGASSTDVCVTVTLVDGLVLSRSAFHHSMNYRSVMVFGRAVKVDGLRREAARPARRRRPRRPGALGRVAPADRQPRCGPRSCSGSRSPRRRPRSGTGHRPRSPRTSTSPTGAA